MSKYKHDYASTKPGTLAGKYLRMFWQPVHRIEDVRIGQAKPLRIMSEDFLIYRGRSGRVYLTAPRCAHRGVVLWTGWVEGEDIRCRYHGWKYRGDGQCVEQPGELDRPFCEKVRIRSYPVEMYRGLVFAYLGEGEPPPFPRYPEFEGEGVEEPRVYERHCNYFNSMDNCLDEVHVAFTHQTAFNRIKEIPVINIERTEFGAVSHCPRPGKGVRVTEFLMPNVTRLKSPSPDPAVRWADYIVWRVPIDDASHYGFGTHFIKLTGDVRRRYLERKAQTEALPEPPLQELAERVLSGRATLEEVKAGMGPRDPHYDVYLEDHVVLGGQGVVADRDNEVLGAADAGVVAVRDLWEEELGRLARGEALKRWEVPPPCRTTSGED